MAIKGTINGIRYFARVETLEVNQTAYFLARDLMVTRDKIFLDILTPVIPEEDFREPYNDSYAWIKRTGPGLTEHDFEINVAILEWYQFIVEGDYIHLNKIYTKERCIIFTDFKLELESRNIPEFIFEPEDEESLKEQLSEALEKENYDLAAELREKIKEASSKKKH